MESLSCRNWLSPVPPDNHDLISMKLYQLTVHRTPEEEKKAEEEEEELTVPRVDDMEQFQGKQHFCHSNIYTDEDKNEAKCDIEAGNPKHCFLWVKHRDSVFFSH